MNDLHISFYQTKKFWLATYLLLSSLALLFFVVSLEPPYSIEALLFKLVFSFGGGLFIFFGSSFMGNLGAMLGAAVYVLLVMLILRPLFTNEKKVTLPPQMFLATLFIFGLIYAVALGGFYT